MARFPERSIRSVALQRGAVATLLLSACASSGPEVGQMRASTIERTTFMHVGFGAGPVAFTDGGGRMLEERRYEPFGEPIDAHVSDDKVEVIGSPDLVDRDLSPSGARTDAATGWSDHGARWLAPETGQWLSPDPPVVGPRAEFMAAPWSLHPYQYVDQDPVTYWDPDGREPRSAGSQLVANDAAHMELIKWRAFGQPRAEAAIESRVPAGPARAAALQLARSPSLVDRNTAQHLATDFNVLYLEDLVHPQNEGALLASCGLSPDVWQVLVLPDRHAIYVQRNADGTNYKDTLIGRRAKSVDFWQEMERHELNHRLNGDNDAIADSDLVKQFSNELRAYSISMFRDVPAARRTDEVKTHILANYPQIGARYASDAAFRAQVDNAQVTGNVTNR